MAARKRARSMRRASVMAAPPPDRPAERLIDNVGDFTFATESAFWEPKLALHPVPHCLAYIAG
jgi:hypothetical protein